MLSFELSDEQKEIRDWVHDFAEREIRPVAHQYDESEEFPWDVVKKAAKVGLYWVLNGQKVFITNGGIADVHVVVAAVDPDLGTRGQASFIVPKGTKGLSQGNKEKKMGIRASHTAEVLLDEVRVPQECLLGGQE